MKIVPLPSCRSFLKRILASVLSMLLPLAVGSMTLNAQQQDASTAQQAPPIPRDQLEALVAPIALYPDELLGQILVASTYPLEIVQLSQWMEKNSNLKGDALIDAVKKQSWDPSVQALVSFPDIVKQLSENIQWTTDLGNAFLAQQNDVMDAVQSMRMQAKNSGKLQSNQQQRVETTVVENKTVVEIQPSDPQVIYVPSYNPAAVWGAGAYPYPPISYPTTGYIATGLISFGTGVALGSVWGHGGWHGWGWGIGWGHHDITINNNFVRNNNLNRTNIEAGRNTGVWQHNVQHRGGAPYPNRQVTNRYGSSLEKQRQAQPGGAGRNLPRSEFNVGGGRTEGRQVSKPRSADKSAFSGAGHSGSFARESSARGRSSLGGGGRSRGGGGRGGGRRR